MRADFRWVHTAYKVRGVMHARSIGSALIECNDEALGELCMEISEHVKVRRASSLTPRASNAPETRDRSRRVCLFSQRERFEAHRRHACIDRSRRAT